MVNGKPNEANNNPDPPPLTQLNVLRLRYSSSPTRAGGSNQQYTGKMLRFQSKGLSSVGCFHVVPRFTVCVPDIAGGCSLLSENDGKLKCSSRTILR